MSVSTGNKPNIIGAMWEYGKKRLPAYNPFSGEDATKRHEKYKQATDEFHQTLPKWMQAIVPSFGIISPSELDKLERQTTEAFCKKFDVEESQLNDNQKKAIIEEVHGSREGITTQKRVNLFMTLSQILPTIMAGFQVGLGTGITTTISSISTSFAFTQLIELLAGILPKKGGLPIILLTLLQGFGYGPVQGFINSLVEGLFGWLKCLDGNGCNNNTQVQRNYSPVTTSLNYSQGLTDQIAMYSV